MKHLERIMDDLVSLQEVNKNLGLSPETIRKSSSAYIHLFEGITPKTIFIKPSNSRNGFYKDFVTKDEAKLIEHRYAMGKLSKTKSKNKEAQVAAKLCKKLKGVSEYKTDFGRCDIVTEEFCIEVKTFKGWKCAIGQALAYATAENKKPAIALFDHKKVDWLYKQRVTQTCDQFGITIFWV